MSFKDNSLLADLPEALLITTLGGEIAFANRALEQLTGYQSSELLGQAVSRLLPKPERRRVQVIDWLVRWAHDPSPDELRYLNLEMVTKSGEVRRVSLRVSKHLDAGAVYFLVVLRDVTSQQATLASLRHAQLVSNRILAIGEDAIVSIDAAHCISYWNPRAESLFGYTSEEIMGQPLSILLPQAQAEQHEAMIANFVSGPDASRMMGQRGEITGRHKDGHLISLEASITKTSVEGEVILSAQIRDITERKKAERALKESEARFRAVFEHAFEAIAILSPIGKVLELNQAARALLPEGATGTFFWDLNWWSNQADPAQVEVSRENLKRNIEECAESNLIRTRVSLAIGADLHDIDFSLIPAITEDGRVTYIIAEGRDLTSLA